MWQDCLTTPAFNVISGYTFTATSATKSCSTTIGIGTCYDWDGTQTGSITAVTSTQCGVGKVPGEAAAASTLVFQATIPSLGTATAFCENTPCRGANDIAACCNDLLCSDKDGYGISGAVTDGDCAAASSHYVANTANANAACSGGVVSGTACDVSTAAAADHAICCISKLCTPAGRHASVVITAGSSLYAATLDYAVACNSAAGYGNASPNPTACTTTGQPYTYTQCTAIVCTSPDGSSNNVANGQYTPSNDPSVMITEIQLNAVTGFSVSIVCSSGYVGSPATVACTANGAYTYTACSLPMPPPPLPLLPPPPFVWPPPPPPPPPPPLPSAWRWWQDIGSNDGGSNGGIGGGHGGSTKGGNDAGSNRNSGNSLGYLNGGGSNDGSNGGGNEENGISNGNGNTAAAGSSSNGGGDGVGGGGGIAGSNDGSSNAPAHSPPQPAGQGAVPAIPSRSGGDLGALSPETRANLIVGHSTLPVVGSEPVLGTAKETQRKKSKMTKSPKQTSPKESNKSKRSKFLTLSSLKEERLPGPNVHYYRSFGNVGIVGIVGIVGGITVVTASIIARTAKKWTSPSRGIKDPAINHERTGLMVDEATRIGAEKSVVNLFNTKQTNTPTRLRWL